MPVRPTQAYTTFKTQSELLLNFAVLVSYAVPSLRNEIQLIRSGQKPSLPSPDFFYKSNRSSTDDLLKSEARYEQRLAEYVLLSQFSFFESFVIDLVRQMIDFQGGSDFIARTAARSKRYMAPHVTKIAKLKRKLQDSEKSSWRDRYRKYGRLLADERYRFPGELLAAYGVRHLVSKLSKLKAHEIPDLLVDGLLMDLTKSEMKKYHEIR